MFIPAFTKVSTFAASIASKVANRLDEVRAIAGGHVVYTNTSAGHSNYGRYVVIEHRWGGSPYYSLYGHLSSIGVETGQTVQRGEQIAIMGHTGTGH